MPVKGTHSYFLLAFCLAVTLVVVLLKIKRYRHKDIVEYRDLLSRAQYRDPYFDFMYYADQLFVSVLLVVVLDIQ